MLLNILFLLYLFFLFIEHQQSFDKLKNELIADRAMSYFDPNKETMLIVDASPVGLAALPSLCLGQSTT
jgi:hypothetical protein